MPTIEKHDLLELELLKHVEQSPRLNNRMAAGKLGCSVKLAHELLRKMVERGSLHVRKHHSRRWDYFLTPQGIAEKARLTYEFLDFSMQFYHEARRQSSRVCRDLAESGRRSVAFLGAGDLGEIVYLGVKEWNLELNEIFDDDRQVFLGQPVKPLAELATSRADAIIVCLYDPAHPMRGKYLPNRVPPRNNMLWVFGNYQEENQKSEIRNSKQIQDPVLNRQSPP
jgi:hypothetical protein